MVARDIELVSRAWAAVAPIVFVPRTDEEYARLVAVLDALIDTAGEQERRPRASLMDVIGALD